MSRTFPADSSSFPIYALAETHGISRTYAMLLRDYHLRVLEAGGYPHRPPPGAWPLGHPWYRWAYHNAMTDHGIGPVHLFLRDVARLYRP